MLQNASNFYGIKKAFYIATKLQPNVYSKIWWNICRESNKDERGGRDY